MKKASFFKSIVVISIIGSYLSSNSICAQNKSMNYLKDTLNNLVLRYMESYNLHGLSYCIILKNDSTIYNCAGKLSENIDIDTSNRWMFASCTKNIISAAIIELQAEGLLTINDPISKYFSHPHIDDTFTIKQLLNHTTNFSEFNGTSKYYNAVINNPEKIWTTKSILDSLISKNNSVADGYFKYCNTNYLILGLIIEKITGNSLNSELTARFFEKLGMNKTSFAPEDFSYSQLAGTWYDTNGDGNLEDLSQFANEPLNATLSIGYGSGNIVSTPLDMAKWVKALYKGKIISDESLDVMKTCTQGTCSDGVFRGYGLGMEHLFFNGCNHLGHSGHQIHTSSMFYTPELDVSMAIAFNQSVKKLIKQMHLDMFRIIKDYYSNLSK